MLNTPMVVQAVAEAGETLSPEAIRATLERGLGNKFGGARVLILIPDHTRTLPLPMLFRIVVEILADTQQLDFMVALGTHPPLDEEALCNLVGITRDERRYKYGHIGLLNHAWDDPGALADIGTLTQDEIKAIAGDYWHPSLGGDVPVQINRRIMEYDQIVILGPTFPHEVVGFSGGAKYLFPGISGPDLINVTHWLGALMTIMGTIGVKETPMREMIHAAAALVPRPLLVVSLVVVGHDVAGLFIGDYLHAFYEAVEVSSQRHIRWVDKPFRQVLSWAPPMYDELWTGAKAMYKLEPAIEDGGEVIVYAPHLETVSHVHGEYLYQIGYHVRDYFLKQWDQFRHIPLGVLAHSTHLKGSGTFEDGVEQPRIRVTMASKISAADCARLNLGYLDPEQIHPHDWADREEDGVLFVPKAGEILYRVRR
jgi:lactate racemase